MPYKEQPKTADLPDLPKGVEWFSTAEFAHFSGLTVRRVRAYAEGERMGRRKKTATGETTRQWEFSRKELINFRNTKRAPGKLGSKRAAEGKQ